MDFMAFFAVADNSANAGILENGSVKPGSLFGLIVEPQTGCNFVSEFWHDVSPINISGAFPLTVGFSNCRVAPFSQMLFPRGTCGAP